MRIENANRKCESKTRIENANRKKTRIENANRKRVSKTRIENLIYPRNRNREIEPMRFSSADFCVTPTFSVFTENL
jgi:hypothetical protein